MKYEGFGSSIFKICIMQILRNRWESTCAALMGFEEVTTSEESLLEVLGLR